MNQNKKMWLSLVVIGLFTIMSNLDSSIVNIALPTLAKEFGIATSAASYTVIIYMVVMASLLILGGRLGDILGKSYLFKIGMVIFTLGSLMASINLGFAFLLAARVIQAIGAAATLSNSYGLIAQIFPPQTRGQAMGYNSLFISAGFIAGPALGGLLLQYFQWNSIFLINVPIGIIAIWMGFKYLPKDRVSDISKANFAHFDWLGSFLLFVTIATLILFLETCQNLGFTNGSVLIMLVIFLVAAVLFGLQEQRQAEPILDFTLFKNSTFTLSLLALVFVMMVNSFYDIVFPLYLQSVLQWAVGIAGLMMIAFPVVMAIASPVGGSLGDHFGRKTIITIGASLTLIAQLMYMTFGLQTSIILMLVGATINGVGTGFFVSNDTTLIMADVPAPQLGVAGAVQALLSNIGNVLGVVFANLSLYTTMSVKAGHQIGTIPANHPEWFIDGMHVAFGLTALFMIISLILVLVLREKKA